MAPLTGGQPFPPQNKEDLFSWSSQGKTPEVGRRELICRHISNLCPVTRYGALSWPGRERCLVTWQTSSRFRNLSQAIPFQGIFPAAPILSSAPGGGDRFHRASAIGRTQESCRSFPRLFGFRKDKTVRCRAPAGAYPKNMQRSLCPQPRRALPQGLVDTGTYRAVC